MGWMGTKEYNVTLAHPLAYKELTAAVARTRQKSRLATSNFAFNEKWIQLALSTRVVGDVQASF